jgi:hypothetical protein
MASRKKKTIEGAVICSDLHCGSAVGLWPDGHETSTGNKISLGNNLHQQWLWQCWQDAIKQAVAHFKGRPFALIVNGDCIEGRHHGTSEIVAALNHDHSMAAVECLRPLSAAAAVTYMTAGTECHVGDWEKMIASELKAKWLGDKGLIEIHGTLLDIAHHMPTSARAYLEAGAMSISMGNARQNYSRVGHRVPKVFLRGHRHVGGLFSDAAGLFMVTPAWQLLTRYGHKVVGDSICRPGIGILDWAGSEKGSIPQAKILTYEPKETQPVGI